MHLPPLLSTQESVNAALRYIHARGAGAKLATPVPVLFSSPNHAAALKQHRAAREAKSAPVSWRSTLRVFNYNPA